MNVRDRYEALREKLQAELKDAQNVLKKIERLTRLEETLERFNTEHQLMRTNDVITIGLSGIYEDFSSSDELDQPIVADIIKTLLKKSIEAHRAALEKL